MSLPPRPRLPQNQRIASANPSKSVQSQQPQPPASAPSTLPPEITPVPEGLRTLEPEEAQSVTIEDPVFNTGDAAEILGVTADRLEKWRQRGKGPDFIQREKYGQVRYELSALNVFKARRRIRPSRGKRRVRGQEQ